MSRQRSETSATIDSTHVSAAHLVGDADQLARLVQNLLANAVRQALLRSAIGPGTRLVS